MWRGANFSFLGTQDEVTLLKLFDGYVRSVLVSQLLTFEALGFYAEYAELRWCCRRHSGLL